MKNPSATPPEPLVRPEKLSTPSRVFALIFGLFLGLCIWKFGNPVILDRVISAPVTTSDYLNEAWPIHWVGWLITPLVIVGGFISFQGKFTWPRPKWLWLLPLAWLIWQFISATTSVDMNLTNFTLWQLSGCVACYLFGAGLWANRTIFPWLLAGILVAFTFSLMRGVDQRLFEFPVNYQVLVEGQRTGWTNLPPETVISMKQDGAIVNTNGVDVANPLMLAKFANARVIGTLVYPNALAGLILLLLPASVVLAFNATRTLKPPIRFAVIAMVIFLGGATFFWTGSKLGWLLGLLVTGLFLLRLNWSAKLKILAVASILVLGLGVFAVRFHHYFAAGATSVGARFDYWRAALQTTADHPITGTGPGTFQRPYARLKSPDAEMARLAHNDYLEQFSDSGLPGGLAYSAWIVLALVVAGRKVWRQTDPLPFALFAGVLAWFVQGFGEFSLYIPALAWTAFTLLGCLIAWETAPGIIEFDKKSPAR